jgi:hypothetical protein
MATVYAGTITSSPTPTSAASRAECMVVVPLACRMPNLRPNLAANCSSSRAAIPGELALWKPKSSTSFT